MLCTWLYAVQSCNLHVTSAAVEMVYAQQEDFGTKWRMTKFGWRDASRWEVPKPVKFERRIELVHPLLFSALLVLSSTGLLIWAAEGDAWLAKRKRND